jgi:uncharacterized protein with ParB-like and HNH nuclease domain
MSLILIAGRSKDMSKKKDVIERIPSEINDNEISLKGYDILTYPADFTIEVLVGKWRKGEIHIPALQRKFIWNQTRASKLIESFLMGLPVPPVFFYLERDTNKLLVVDGHQRLASIAYFYSGVFGEPKAGIPDVPFELIGLDDKSPYLLATYEKLKSDDEAAFNRLNNSVMRSFVVKQIDPQDDTSIFQIFERLNTGGVILRPQEIRNCIYEGTFNTSLNNLNKYNHWRKIFGSSFEDKRKRDGELILRFFALFYKVPYKKPMKKFLNDFMKEHRRDLPAELEKFENLFKRTTDAVLRILGPKPFNLRTGLNAAVYDATFVAFARNLKNLSNHRKLKDKFEELTRNKAFLRLVSQHTTDEDNVPRRIRKAKKALFG